MRIVTRPDFDGIVCAVLLQTAEKITQDILWLEPNEIQAGKVSIQKGDILANLPYSADCTMWFDHHISNKPDNDFKGAFAVAPSAANVIDRYYKALGKLDTRFDELVLNTDIIDAADLSKDQVRHPENYPYILLSMTIQNRDYQDVPYWNRLVALLKNNDIDPVLNDREVAKRCSQVIQENAAFEAHLIQHTKIIHNISITDFRSFDTIPDGNRFLTYSLFPETIASVKIRFDGPEHENVLLSIGKNIFNNRCNINIGKLLSQFGGGGHAGAGGCTLKADISEKAIGQILETMVQNKSRKS